MQLPTYSQIKTKIENDLDLIDQDFVSETELLGYINEALADAEAVVHNLGLESKYFLTMDTMTITSGTSDYSMPSNIYANKLVKIFFNDTGGTRKYEIFRIRNLNDIPWILTGEDYKYNILNLELDATPHGGVTFRMYPTPVEVGPFIQRYYIRNVRVMTTSTTDPNNVFEIAESVNFLYQHIKVRVYEKEGNPNLEKAVMDLKLQHDLMVQNLQEQVQDNNTQIMPDFTFYEDMYIDMMWRL